MRRPLALVTTILLTTALALAAMPAQAGPYAPSGEVAPPGPILGEGRSLPLAPEGYTVVDEALVGDTVWVVLDQTPNDASGSSLWRTPSDGSGTWQPFLDASGGAPPARVISSDGGDALAVGLQDGGTLILWPGGQRTVAGPAVVAPGGRLVQRYDLTAKTVTIETLDGSRALRTGDYGLGAGDGLAWTDDDTDLFSEDLLGGTGTDTVQTHEALPCDNIPDSSPRSRGRWIIARCDHVLPAWIVADRTGQLRPWYTIRRASALGAGFLVFSGYGGNGGTPVVLDPVTSGITEVPDAVRVTPDGADTARVLTRSASGAMRVLPIQGLAEESPVDTEAPQTTIVAQPTLNGQSSASYANPLVAWSSTEGSERVRFRLWTSGVPTALRPGTNDVRVYFDLDDPDPCFELQATDRAGNVGNRAKHCFVWDEGPPEVDASSVRPDRAQTPSRVRMRWSGAFSDVSEIVGYPVSTRFGDRFGRMGDWVEGAERTEPTVVIALRPGTRRCVALRARDVYSKVGRAAGGCATAPYDDAELVGGDHTLSSGIGALGPSYRRLLPGVRSTTPERLFGRVVVAKVRRGPTYGVAEMIVGGTVVQRFDLNAPRNGWRWVTYVSPTPIESTVAVRAAKGTVLLDAIGVSRPGDVYPPRQ